ncbi:MFS transporter [Embleya sp. NBC_00896]|uniref:MFS transporter n=1 Tax=Embleya sp. NBC_00896 TaxID=2975961 RepID=UPI00386BE473|nr:MFS transporter [Embleya sp. NBC_00896]
MSDADNEGRGDGMAWGAVKVLKDRNAGLYLSGVVVSNFGSGAMALVAGVWAKSLTGSDSVAALMALGVFAPSLLGPLLGAVVDRLPARRLLVVVNLVLAVLLTATLAVRSQAQVWILFLVMLGYGIGFVLLDAAESTALSAGVTPGLLGDLNGMRLSAAEGMKLIAPLVGAGLFAWSGGHTVALLDAGTFVLAAGLFGLMRFDQPARERVETGWLRHTAEGTRYLWAHRPLRRLVLAGGLAMVVSGISGGAIYAVVDDGLGRSPAFTGVLYTAQGVGSVAVGLCAGALIRRLGAKWFAVCGLALFAVGVGLRVFASLPVVLGGTVLIGFGLPAIHVAALTVLQRETPAQLVGRVAATAGMIMFAPTAFAILGVAGLLAVLDYRIILLGAAALGVLVTLYCAAGRGERAPDPEPAMRDDTADSRHV